MALFKPEASTGTSNFSGICNCTIVDIQDKSANFDWADIYLQVTLLQDGSKYTRNANIVGGFETEPNGNVTGGSVIKRMYSFFAAINCDAGVNIKGEWEDAEGNKIDDIAEFLSFATEDWDGETPGKDGKYLAYFYKQAPKKPGKQAYNVAHYKIYPAGGNCKDQLQNDIDWMKSKGYIKEDTGEAQPVNSIDSDSLGSLALDNL
tara:strand:- start:114 stop:728 length:615 start_codon:yes stop_codon:yes gene_type:complete